MADLTLVLNTPKTGLFTLTDNKSGVVLTTAVFSNQAVGTNSNPEFATFALDPANASQLIATPIAAGTGSVVISADATYTDLGNNTQASGSFTATKNFTVVLGADGVNFDVVFP